MQYIANHNMLMADIAVSARIGINYHGMMSHSHIHTAW